MSISFPSRLRFEKAPSIRIEEVGGEKESKRVLQTFELITTLYDSRWAGEEIYLVLVAAWSRLSLALIVCLSI